MNTIECLRIVDKLIFAQTGKHLSNFQRMIIKGVWEGKSYKQIAEDCLYSERHSRDTGYKLWQSLSNQIGEDIHKSNFAATIERMFDNVEPKQNEKPVTSVHLNQRINDELIFDKTYYRRVKE